MTKKIQENIRNFLLTNQLFRKVRSFFYLSVKPLLIRSILILITFIILSFAVIKFFKPALLEKIYAKSSFYFLHYLHLDNREFEQINISGNNRVSKEKIIEVVNFSRKKILENSSSTYQPLIQNLIDELKTNLPWINKVVVVRSMPDILNISVVEYEPFAIWQNDGKKYIIDKDGNTVPYEDAEEFHHMVILSGKGANTHAKSLFNIFTIDSELSKNVYSATWVGNRRWDVRFENGLLIKLPEVFISEAWQHLIKIYNTPGSVIGLRMIDLRIKDKVYLEYDDSVMKEMKQL